PAQSASAVHCVPLTLPATHFASIQASSLPHSSVEKPMPFARHTSSVLASWQRASPGVQAGLSTHAPPSHCCDSGQAFSTNAVPDALHTSRVPLDEQRISSGQQTPHLVSGSDVSVVTSSEAVSFSTSVCVFV